MKPLLVATIRLYQGWSARRVPTCRFHPSCSQYAVEAISAHGSARGIVMAIRRVGRCRPGGGFGFDPIPEPKLIRSRS